MASTEVIASLIEPSLRTMGFELVQVRMTGEVRRTLQVMAEPLERERQMTVDDCADISHAVSAILDVHDPVPGAYALEVTSPGIDRPLVKPADFDRFAGHAVRIEIDPAIDRRKRFSGQLNGVIDGDVSIIDGGEELRLPLARIRKARLLIDDVLPPKRKPGGGRRTKPA